MAPGDTPDTSFALPHAISLAEAGKTVQDKKTGMMNLYLSLFENFTRYRLSVLCRNHVQAP